MREKEKEREKERERESSVCVLFFLFQSNRPRSLCSTKYLYAERQTSCFFSRSNLVLNVFFFVAFFFFSAIVCNEDVLELVIESVQNLHDSYVRLLPFFHYAWNYVPLD